jgi:hypothetical protein
VARPIRGAKGSTVAVDGLDKLVRDFGRMGSGVKREMIAELRDLAGVVSKTAQAIAVEKGLAPPGRSGRGKGRELRLIRPFNRGTTVGVRSGATRDGYSYPIRHEYEGRGGSAPGPRAYLEPALDRDTKKVEAGLGDMLDRLSSDNGFGRGGIL